MPNLKVMSWNLRNFGQRERLDDVYSYIVRTIDDVNPHICAIVEVMGDHGIQYVQMLCMWLNQYSPDKYWELVLPPFNNNSYEFTGGEAYAILYQLYADDPAAARAAKEGRPSANPSISVVQDSVAYIRTRQTPNGSERLDFPMETYRRPMRCLFQFSGGMKTTKTGDGTWRLPFVVFHAPSPRHNENTVLAIQHLGLIDEFIDMEHYPDAVLAADLNLDSDNQGMMDIDNPRVRAGFSGLKGDGAFDPLYSLGFFNHNVDNEKPTTIQTKAVTVERPNPTCLSDLLYSPYDKLLVRGLDDERRNVIDEVVLEVPEFLTEIEALMRSPGGDLALTVQRMHELHSHDRYYDWAKLTPDQQWWQWVLLVANCVSDHLPLILRATFR